MTNRIQSNSGTHHECRCCAYLVRIVDLGLARKVMAHDDVVDTYFSKVRTALIDVIGSHPSEGEYALDLLMIAKYFERIGDHCTNIGEWVEFSVTGVHKDCQ